MSATPPDRLPDSEAEEAGAPPAAPTPTEVADDPEALRAALEERMAQYTRLAADFENHRKRTARELADRARYAAEEAARALLPVLDNLRRAVEHAPPETPGGLLEGLQHTVRQFEEALAAVGVTPIEAEGARFDPALHEAVLGEESDEVEHDIVVDDLQTGYRLHDRVLRPAMVKVAHPAAPAPRQHRK